jgi:hypothetical protein
MSKQTREAIAVASAVDTKLAEVTPEENTFVKMGFVNAASVGTSQGAEGVPDFATAFFGAVDDGVSAVKQVRATQRAEAAEVRAKRLNTRREASYQRSLVLADRADEAYYSGKDNRKKKVESDAQKAYEDTPEYKNKVTLQESNASSDAQSIIINYMMDFNQALNDGERTRENLPEGLGRLMGQAVEDADEQSSVYRIKFGEVLAGLAQAEGLKNNTARLEENSQALLNQNLENYTETGNFSALVEGVRNTLGETAARKFIGGVLPGVVAEAVRLFPVKRARYEAEYKRVRGNLATKEAQAQIQKVKNSFTNLTDAELEEKYITDTLAASHISNPLQDLDRILDNVEDYKDKSGVSFIDTEIGAKAWKDMQLLVKGFQDEVEADKLLGAEGGATQFNKASTEVQKIALVKMSNVISGYIKEIIVGGLSKTAVDEVVSMTTLISQLSKTNQAMVLNPLKTTLQGTFSLAQQALREGNPEPFNNLITNVGVLSNSLVSSPTYKELLKDTGLLIYSRAQTLGVPIADLPLVVSSSQDATLQQLVGGDEPKKDAASLLEKVQHAGWFGSEIEEVAKLAVAIANSRGNKNYEDIVNQLKKELYYTSAGIKRVKYGDKSIALTSPVQFPSEWRQLYKAETSLNGSATLALSTLILNTPSILNGLSQMEVMNRQGDANGEFRIIKGGLGSWLLEFEENTFWQTPVKRRWTITEDRLLQSANDNAKNNLLDHITLRKRGGQLMSLSDFAHQ